MKIHSVMNRIFSPISISTTVFLLFIRTWKPITTHEMHHFQRPLQPRFRMKEWKWTVYRLIHLEHKGDEWWDYVSENTDDSKWLKWILLKQWVKGVQKLTPGKYYHWLFWICLLLGVLRTPYWKLSKLHETQFQYAQNLRLKGQERWHR